jgi:hypothetical protein
MEPWMRWYLYGLCASVLIWAANVAKLLYRPKSLRERNLHRIGLRTSRVSTQLKFLYGSDLSQSRSITLAIFWAIVLGEMLLLLGSWLYVAWWAAWRVRTFANDYSPPREVMDYRWKLRNMDMPFDQHVRESIKANGGDLSKFAEIHSDTLALMRRHGLKIDATGMNVRATDGPEAIDV